MNLEKNTEFQRGEIYYINKGMSNSVGSEQYPDRPGVIVSNNRNNARSETVEVVYLTTQPKCDLPTHCTIRSTGRLSTALCEQIHTVSTKRIGNYITKCTDNEMLNIEIGMMISVGIEGGRNTARKNQGTNKENTSLEELIQLRTERDIFKQMYEQMMNSLARGKTNE